MKYLKLFEDLNTDDKIQDIKDVFQDLEDEIKEFTNNNMEVKIVGNGDGDNDFKGLIRVKLTFDYSKDVNTSDFINQFILPKIKRLERMNIFCRNYYDNPRIIVEPMISSYQNGNKTSTIYKIFFDA